MRLDGLLRRVTSLIVCACDPEKILLFGSYAKGQENADSDVDILVIGDFQGSSFLLEQELRQLLHSSPLRMDIHIATQGEIETEVLKPHGFLSSILSSGHLLYSKRGTSIVS